MGYIKEMAIGCITCLTGYALYLGYDNALFGVVIAAIAGIAGYELAVEKKAK